MLRTNMCRVGLAALVLTMSVSVQAEAQGRLRGIVRAGADFGGDKVLEFEYEDGSTPSMQAGGGVMASGGAALQLIGSAAQALDLEANVGVKYRTIPPASNQSASWIRFPVEGMLLYRMPFGLRAGAGVAMHVANKLETSGGAANGKVEFKNKPGMLLKSEYSFGNWALDVRYTKMDYEISKGGTGTVHADSFGAGMSFSFGGSSSKAMRTH